MEMLKPVFRNGLIVFACFQSYGQTADKTLTFDAASVKPAALPTPDGRGRIMMQGPSGGPGTKDPGRIHYPYSSLRNLLMTAYDVKAFQIQGPQWLDTERFEVNATMPPDTTKEQFGVMLRNLLTERFKMTVHKESKELPMYSLVVAKNGPKLKESAPVAPAKEDADSPPPPTPPLPAQPKIGPDGFPELPLPAGGRAGLFTMMMPGRARLIGQQQTMLDLTNRLTNQLSRPVSDATGLTAKYDFILTFSPEGMNGMLGPMPMGGVGMMAPAPPPPPPGGGGVSAPGGGMPEAETPPDIFRALKEQLGLALEAKKGPVEMIVIDHIEKTATEN
jgi:uncharacterized protein (TIGR03435 family)